MTEEHGLVVREEVPKEVVEAGRAAAQELTKIVSSREKKLVLGGKQYLFFEDWQTIGKFYGVTAEVERTEEIRENDELIGFVAHAVALHNGQVVSAADAECTRDEQKWAPKPRFQLRSMAQTRACAKALRNCLGWVAVLAGYEATPAEEMADDSERPKQRQPRSTPERSPEDEERIKQGELTRGGMMTTITEHWKAIGIDKDPKTIEAWCRAAVSKFTTLTQATHEEINVLYRKAISEIVESREG